MDTIILGIVATHVAEVVTALNLKLKDTLLKGDGAFIVASAVSLVAALYHVITTPGLHIGNIHDVVTVFSEVFAVSQVYFLLAVKKLNLDVQTPVSITTTTGSVNTAVSNTAPAVTVGSSAGIPNIQRLS